MGMNILRGPLGTIGRRLMNYNSVIIPSEEGFKNVLTPFLK